MYNLDNYIDPLSNFLHSSENNNARKDIKRELNRLLHSLDIVDTDDIIHQSNCVLGGILKYILYKQGKLKKLESTHSKLDNRTLRKAALKSNIFPKNNLGKLTKQLVKQLSGIIFTINQIRNKYSDAHSEDPKQPSTPKEYAMLCVYTTFTLVNFLLSRLYKLENNPKSLNDDSIDSSLANLVKMHDDYIDPINFVNSDEPPYE